jgi:hypothetical protein
MRTSYHRARRMRGRMLLSRHSHLDHTPALVACPPHTNTHRSVLTSQHDTPATNRPHEQEWCLLMGLHEYRTPAWAA